MDREEIPTLVDRLKRCTALWADAHDAMPSRLARLVLNNGAFFRDLEEGTRGPTTSTLESFATFLANPANWPAREVPQEALAFAHVTGVGAPSPNDSAIPAPFGVAAAAGAAVLHPVHGGDHG